MGTRSTIQVNDKKTLTTVIFYKHWDGYPSDNLNMFLEAFKSSDVNSFLESCAEYYGRDLNEMIEYCGPISGLPENYMRHGDLEFHYQVSFSEKNINIFGTYGTEDELIKNGLFNPMDEIKSYYKEAQGHYKEKIIKVLTELAALNVTVNKEN